MDGLILISKLSEYFLHKICFYFFVPSLKAKISDKEFWESNVVLDPNELLRQIEAENISVVFACLNDLKYSVHVSHLPFLCRLYRTKLVTLKSGSAVELQSLFGKKNLFMLGISRNNTFIEFCLQFPDIDILDPMKLPQLRIKK